MKALNFSKYVMALVARPVDRNLKTEFASYVLH